jgi:pyruvate-formate lyase-activating enzyme
LDHITKVRVLPYHNFAGSKYDSLGLENTLPETLPTKEEAANAREILRGFGLTVVE